MKKLSVICLLVAGIFLISGCIDGGKTNSKISTSSQLSINETSKETSALPSISNNYSSAKVPKISDPKLIPCEFEINIISYYFVYMRNNEVSTQIPTFDLVEKNYVIYQLSIKNNDTQPLNFSMNKLQLYAGDQVFTSANPEIFPQYIPCCMWVFSDITKENKLNDTQTL